MTYTWLLDPGHGIDTAGKRSPVWPDGLQMFEYEFNRAIVSRLIDLAADHDIDVVNIVPELDDVPLAQRVLRAEAFADASPIYLSIHGNAGGGTGWECYTSPGQTCSDHVATVLCRHAASAFSSWAMRFDYSDGDPDKEAKFYVLRATSMPAVLTESLFMDREKDCRFMASEAGRDLIASLHFGAMLEMEEFGVPGYPGR